ncbi:hypothetical protein BGZ61DRAFT_437853 [Ilyonectria robusta]|uniref:uncharacterized protein n=1 Tax=Ilyonectria robusta TaxID=1079257 RepID=UPI001E8D56F2|nr:uncharacterized protein BGZ61DRAFT_437853 [Ilyonectria robusta]KAH8737208.1 hypothetical protein BGZ61DRAFT_437853 [Ilyonectria robusta]
MVNGNYNDMGVYKDVQEDDTHPQSAHTYVHSPHLSIHHPCAGPIVPPGCLSNVSLPRPNRLPLKGPEAHLGYPTSTYPRDEYCFFRRKCLGPSPARTTTNRRRRDGDGWKREIGPERQRKRKSRNESGSIHCRKLPSSRVGYIPRGEESAAAAAATGPDGDADWQPPGFRQTWRIDVGKS